MVFVRWCNHSQCRPVKTLSCIQRYRKKLKSVLSTVDLSFISFPSKKFCNICAVEHCLSVQRGVHRPWRACNVCSGEHARFATRVRRGCNLWAIMWALHTHSLWCMYSTEKKDQSTNETTLNSNLLKVFSVYWNTDNLPIKIILMYYDTHDVLKCSESGGNAHIIITINTHNLI